MLLTADVAAHFAPAPLPQPHTHAGFNWLSLIKDTIFCGPLWFVETAAIAAHAESGVSGCIVLSIDVVFFTLESVMESLDNELPGVWIAYSLNCLSWMFQAVSEWAMAGKSQQAGNEMERVTAFWGGGCCVIC